MRQVVDGDGDAVLVREYSPYGRVIAESGTGSSGYGFSGEQYGTGLIYLRARYFDPYVDTANRLQTNVFNVPAEEWAQLSTRAAQWARNKQFLDEAIARGDVFLLDTPFVEGIRDTGSFYQQELLYLLERGYQIVVVYGQDWLVPPN